MDSIELVRVGATVKAFRLKTGMTQDQLAAAALVSRPYIANVEAGRKPVTHKTLPKIARALAVQDAAIAILPADELAEDAA